MLADRLPNSTPDSFTGANFQAIRGPGEAIVPESLGRSATASPNITLPFGPGNILAEISTVGVCC